MDWVDKPQNYTGLYGILQLLKESHLNNFLLKALKLGWVTFYLVAFQLQCLDYTLYNIKKLIPVLSGFCNGLLFYLVAFQLQCLDYTLYNIKKTHPSPFRILQLFV